MSIAYSLASIINIQLLTFKCAETLLIPQPSRFLSELFSQYPTYSWKSTIHKINARVLSCSSPFPRQNE